MELAPMFVEQRWNILKHLSEGSYSPLQLAESTHTTIANISQQLRLLEAANLVKKQRVPNRDRGQPRLMFSLSDDYAYIVSLSHKYAKKKLVRLSEQQQAYLKIISIDDPDQRRIVESAYFDLHKHMDDIKAIAVDLSAELMVIVVSDNERLSKNFASHIKFLTVSKHREYLKRKDPAHIVSLYDPGRILEHITAAKAA